MFKIFREPRRHFEKVLISSNANNRNNRIVLNPNIKNDKLSATEQNFLFKSC